MQSLNPISMPLQGVQLIEASAGTGKTYTISTLYLRLLLGLKRANTEEQVTKQDNPAPEKQSPQTQTSLYVDQILVVTFTQAATEEIRDRVRQRIIEARDALSRLKQSNSSAKQTPSPIDPLLAELLQDIREPYQAYLRLDQAAKSMDEAAIYTIHGFCQRMLKTHAFESGVEFDLSFVLDQQDLVDQACKDYWRHCVYSLNREQAQWWLRSCQSPEALQSQINSLLNQPLAKVIPSVTLNSVWKHLESLSVELGRFKHAMITSDFAEQLLKSDLKKTNKCVKPDALEQLLLFCQSDSAWFANKRYSLMDWHIDILGDPGKYKKGGKLFEHALLNSLSRLAENIANVETQLPAALKQDASIWVAARVQEFKNQQALIAPDDLLMRLYQALSFQDGAEQEGLGNAQSVIAQQIANQYPAAMIDEFQDTDPIQYGIFSRIYGNNETSLTLIGDPKQAIYGFRGADIFTYISAKHAVAEQQRYTLKKNWRSSAQLVNAVNRLFAGHAKSFIYNDSIPFVSVDAADKVSSAPFTVAGQTVEALNLTLLSRDNQVISKSQAQPELAEIFANKVAQLLNQAHTGQAKIGERAVQASDICILVRDRNEAALIKFALQNRGVASVFISRDSVFKTDLAKAIFGLLDALYQPNSEAQLRGLLAGPFFQLNYSEIYAVSQDELQWQAYLDLFAEFKRIWQKQGIMALFESILTHCQLPQLWNQSSTQHNLDEQAQIYQTEDTATALALERLLTDYRHLAELLQHKQLELEGAGRLLVWLNGKISQPDSEGGQLRLENDANLVQIVTMHASKGLEYPIVFMPFVMNFRSASQGIYHEQQQLVFDLTANDEAMAKADEERLAEDLRLLYVALTRPVYACYLGIYPVPLGRTKKLGVTQTALGYLLSPQDDASQSSSIDPAEFSEQIQQSLAESTSFEQIEMGSSETVQLITQGSAQSDRLSVRRFTGQIQKNWRLTSFTALSKNKASVAVLPGVDDEAHELDLTDSDQTQQFDPYHFPKGARAGSCLHAIFEQIDFQQPQLNLAEVVEKNFAFYGISEQWQAFTEQWISHLLLQPINAEGLSLSQISSEQRLIEMEFYLPLQKNCELRSTQINPLLQKISGPMFKSLNFDPLKGVLKGFIDLIFEHQGQYFVLDYKSNFLGEQADDYEFDQLEQVMSSHQYHLQYLLYTVALHRMLKARLANYQPEKHLGGVYYLFLRGMHQGQGVYYSKPDRSVIEELDRCFLVSSYDNQQEPA